MTKKILSIVAIIAVLIVGYFVINNNQSNQFKSTNETSHAEIAVKIVKSSDSVGRGSVQLIEDENEPHYCDLVSLDSCIFNLNKNARAKIINIPSIESRNVDWISGCDNFSKTAIDNDTCEFNVNDSNKIIEVGFIKF